MADAPSAPGVDVEGWAPALDEVEGFSMRVRSDETAGAVQVLQERLGHASFLVTADTYSQVRRAVDAQ